MRLTQAQLAHIKSLEDKNGRLSAKQLLVDARKPKSPLHSLRIFKNWDVKHASEQYWLNCCQRVLGAVTYQYTEQETIIKAPMYVHDTSIGGNEGGYRSIVSMKPDRQWSRASLKYTLEIAAGHLRRAYDLAGPMGLTKEIDALLAQIAGVQRLIADKKAA